MITGDVNPSFLLIVRTSKQKANQSAKDLSWFNGICKTLYPTLAEHTVSFFLKDMDETFVPSCLNELHFSIRGWCQTVLFLI